MSQLLELTSNLDKNHENFKMIPYFCRHFQKQINNYEFSDHSRI